MYQNNIIFSFLTQIWIQQAKEIVFDKFGNDIGQIVVFYVVQMSDLAEESRE